MNKLNLDNPGVIAPPLLIYISALAISYSLHQIWPWRITSFIALKILGVCLIVIGSMLIIWARNTMYQAKTHMNPYKPALTLLVTGPFGFSRNPIYVAMTLIYFGITFLASSVWPFIILVPVIGIMAWGVILREEKHLEAKFGLNYQVYKTKVRRWL